MRVILDVDVLVSAAISARGSPGKILDFWEQEQFDLVVSPPILEELERVIHYPRIQQKYELSEEYVEKFLALIGNEAIVVNPSNKLNVIEKDPSDNRYLECAKEGNASYIVTGDKHLLDLEEYNGIVILTPTGFLAILRLEGKGG
ncbi:MAG: putative toxin-antitoxin system toxin component, PIN family [Anaerolineales bacterium]|jgi:putative PIN family toxin of toxin-antitoxin system